MSYPQRLWTETCAPHCCGGDASEEAWGRRRRHSSCEGRDAGCAVRLMLFMSTGGSDGECNPLCVWHVYMCEVRVCVCTYMYIYLYIYKWVCPW